MTMAAAFKTANAILLCAETEHSSSAEKKLDSKLSDHEFNGGRLAFAIAGRASHAKMAIRDCCYDLPAGGERCPPKRVELAIRKAVREAYDKYVAPAKDDENNWFDLIVAVCMDGLAPTLFVSSGRALDEVPHYIARGTGMFIADQIVAASFDSFASLPDIATIALHVLSSSKRHAPNVSGPSQFMSIVNGRFSDIIGHDFTEIETLIGEYEQQSARVLLALRSPEGLSGSIAAFSKAVTGISQKWKQNSGYADLFARLQEVK